MLQADVEGGFDFGHLPFQPIDAFSDVEALGDVFEALRNHGGQAVNFIGYLLLDRIEALVDGIKASVNCFKAFVNCFKAPVDSRHRLVEFLFGDGFHTSTLPNGQSLSMWIACRPDTNEIQCAGKGMV